MSYLLVIAISLSFLFLWSKLPDPTGPQPETRNGLRDRESNGTPIVKTGETLGAELHADQPGEADDLDRVGHCPTGTFEAVLTVVGPLPRSPYGPSEVSEGLTLTVTGTFLLRGWERGPIASSGRVGTTMPYATNGNEDKRFARKGAKR